MGLLTLKKYRGTYLKKLDPYHKKLKNKKIPLSKKKDPNVTLGIFFIALGIGFLIGSFTKLLIILLDPIPDGILFNFLHIIDLDTEIMINHDTILFYLTDPLDKAIYYFICYVSFLGFLSIILGFRSLITQSNQSHLKSLEMLIFGFISSFLAGFSTFLPLFL